MNELTYKFKNSTSPGEVIIYLDDDREAKCVWICGDFESEDVPRLLQLLTERFPP